MDIHPKELKTGIHKEPHREMSTTVGTKSQTRLSDSTELNKVPLQGAWFWSLIRELKSCVPHSTDKKKKPNRDCKRDLRFCLLEKTFQMISFMPTGIGHSFSILTLISVKNACCSCFRGSRTGITHTWPVCPLTLSIGSGLQQIQKRKHWLRSQAPSTQHHTADHHPPPMSWLMNEWRNEHMDTDDTSKAAWTPVLSPTPLYTESIPGVPFVIKKNSNPSLFNDTVLIRYWIDRLVSNDCGHER